MKFARPRGGMWGLYLRKQGLRLFTLFQVPVY